MPSFESGSTSSSPLISATYSGPIFCASSSAFCQQVAALGDVNGDGRGDVAFGISDDKGVVTFAVTDATAETVTYTATSATYGTAVTQTATIVVGQATLTVTAASASRAYGAANPTFTETVTGYQNGDTSSVITGSIPNGSSAATATTGIGS